MRSAHLHENLAISLGVGLFAVALLIAEKKPGLQTTRGIRNNNPGNIKYSEANQWIGQTGTDGTFAVFSDPVYGIRAAAVLLKNDIRAGKATVEQLITEWAPKSDDNPTGSYVEYVARAVGVQPWEPVTIQDIPDMLAAMIYFENGVQPYSLGLIQEGVALA